MAIDRKDIPTTPAKVSRSKDEEAVTIAVATPENIAQAAALCEDGEAGVVRHFNKAYTIEVQAKARRAGNAEGADPKDFGKIAQNVADTHVSAPRGSGTRKGRPKTAKVDKKVAGSFTKAQREALEAAGVLIAEA